MEWPYFVVIGGQKAGSTFVHAALRAHPEIYMPEGETPLFEEACYSADAAEVLKHDMETAAEGRLWGIKRPGYLAKPGCAERIAQHLPQAKIVLVVRDPVQRALSAYFHYIRYRHIPAKGVNSGMRELLEDRGFAGFPRAQEIIEFGMYYKYLQKYITLFGAARVWVVDLAALQAHPAAEWGYVSRFLGVDATFFAEKTFPKRNTGQYSMADAWLQAQRYRLRYDLAAGQIPPPERPLSPLGKVADKALCVAVAVERAVPLPRARLEKEVEEQLRARYAEDWAALQRWMAERREAMS